GLDDAIDLASELAGIDDLRLSYREPVLDEFDEFIAEMFENEDYPVISVPHVIKNMLGQVPASLLEPGVKARLGFDLKL
ncbi:MAG: hypothetical protein QGF46_05445, partial [Planctomycetota bacterium]|nr:hypothetical protein [Planctomycetota bacterium]